MECSQRAGRVKTSACGTAAGQSLRLSLAAGSGRLPGGHRNRCSDRSIPAVSLESTEAGLASVLGKRPEPAIGTAVDRGSNRPSIPVLSTRAGVDPGWAGSRRSVTGWPARALEPGRGNGRPEAWPAHMRRRRRRRRGGARRRRFRPLRWGGGALLRLATRRPPPPRRDTMLTATPLWFKSFGSRDFVGCLCIFTCRILQRGCQSRSIG